MKRAAMVGVCIVVLAGLFAYAMSSSPSRRTHDDIAGKPYLKATADQLQGTIITPTMDQTIGQGKNVIWCGTFQYAWNELAKLSGGPVVLDTPSPIDKALNTSTVSTADLESSSYVARAGFAEDGLAKQIRGELNKKFRGAETPGLLDAAPGSGFVAYSYLFKELPYQWAFGRFGNALSFGGKPVECFGIQQFVKSQKKEVRAATQVSVLDYRDWDDFVIELKTRDTEHSLILAKVHPEKTLAGTVQKVEARASAANPRGMKEYTDLYVPVLDFDITRNYTELLGRTIRSGNRRLDGQPIEIALQQIRLRMDERGTVLKSEAMMAMGMGEEELVFNKPYLILLKRKDARNPYFAAWIGNTELMIPGKH